MKTLFRTITILGCLLSMPLSAATIQVPGDQPTIQSGIDAVSDGDTVLVADGTWTGEGNRDIDFQGKAITVISASDPASCIIDCQGSDVDEHRGVLFQNSEGRNSVLSGFTIRNGYVNEEGGGIYCIASPTIQDTIIENCEAHQDGAGLFCGGSGRPLIVGCLISGNQESTGTGGGVNISESSMPVFKNTEISSNQAPGVGAGIHALSNFELHCCQVKDNTGGGVSINNDNGSTLVTESLFEGNLASYSGGGIYCSDSRVIITNTKFIGNQSESRGGALYCRSDSRVTVVNCLFEGNSAASGGAYGGYHSYGHGTGFINTTLAGNTAKYAGGGIHFTDGGVSLHNSIIWNNSAAIATQIYIGSSPYEIAQLSITYSDLEGGYEAIENDASMIHYGSGMIDEDPLFIAGPESDFYLSQIDAGQPDDSPCLDSGDPLRSLPIGTTRTDGILDTGIPDMGWHDPPAATPYLVCGAGPAETNPPLVRVYPPVGDTTPFVEFQAFGSIGYGVNVVCSDLDNDGQSEILVGPGPGPMYGPQVRGFEITGEPLTGLSFLAYGTNKFGVNVAAGDLDGDGIDEIITGAGPGAVFGPHVRAWIYNGPSGVTPYPGVSYFAYGAPKWGVNVAAGDIDGDGYDEIVSGAGPGAVYGPHVRGWDVDGNQTVSTIPQVSYFAYSTLKYGVNVTVGDVDGDGIDEIVTGAGPGAVFGPHVRGWNYDGNVVGPLPNFSFFAWLTGSQSYGVNVYAGTDLNSDGHADIIVGRGPDLSADTEVKVFTYYGWTVQEWTSLEAFPGLTTGANVAAGRF